ncbi:MAG: hypothetical protein EBZ67_14050, partial [Chitinophagia bacterium]|nr:hypothetical protein [Chitinophagia bacterium]
MLLLVLAAIRTAAQLALPIEFRHVQNDDVWLNFQSRLGVPISTITNVPPGSNGKLPTTSASTGLTATASPNQFRSFLSFGAALGLPFSQWQQASNSAVLKAGTTAFNGAVATQMRLPMALNAGAPIVVMRRAVVGATYLSRPVSFSFGEVILPPDTDEFDKPLGSTPRTAYWQPEPFPMPGQTNGYYYSEHSGLVYAIQPGPVLVTWRRATPATTNEMATSTYVNINGAMEGGNRITYEKNPNGSTAFLLNTKRYLVSGGAYKPPRRMYWTAKGFQNLGVPIRVPAARVGAVNIVFNSNFPRTVASEFAGIGSTGPTDGSTNATLKELRTLWYDEQLGNIYAYNAEGRVFVELLGDRRADGRTHQQLGVEIVDVLRQAIPSPVTVALGERVIPPDGGSVEELFPSPLQQGLGGQFVYQHSVNGAEKPLLYATKETRNLNDYLVHWLEGGEAGLRWPKSLGRYSFVWPSDVSKYSHYIRPAAATEAVAAETAVWIDPANAPNIEYQDALDRPRAKFTPDFRFYTWLDASQPVHRTLLRFASGDNIGFERVFSWLDSSLRATNFVGGTISDGARNIITNLSAWVPERSRFEWPASGVLSAPRVLNATAPVGQRIGAPPEIDAVDGPGYVAGYINRARGTSYSTTAYVNPLLAGFSEANKGSIIPVNAIPGTNSLEVWWFRPNSSSAGLNANNSDLGFKT